ncbi:hypothetical protein SLA2020_393220 [Shorea laevis]
MADSEEVTVFGVWASHYSRRVELALKLKGIPYRYFEEDLSNKSPLLLKYNPVHKKIPVLVHNGKPVAESLVILEYIDETWKNNPLLPQDPYARAMARFWAKFIDETILALALKLRAGTEEEQKQTIEELRKHLKVLENQLEGKEFFGGDRIGYLDVIATAIAFWMVVAQEARGGLEVMSEERFPILYKWIGRITKIDVVNDWRPPKEKLTEYVRARFASPKSA